MQNRPDSSGIAAFGLAFPPVKKTGGMCGGSNKNG